MGNIDELNAMFDEEAEIVFDSELSMKITNNEFPMPIKVTIDDLKKQSNDWFSGSLPFNDTVSSCVIFIQYEGKIEIMKILI